MRAASGNGHMNRPGKITPRGARRPAWLALAVVGGLFAVMAGCGSGNSAGLPPTGGGGGGGGTPPAGSANVAALSVYAGPAGNYTDGVFTTVRICVPGSTTECQNIKDVLVDTGSYGLRLLGSQVGVNLPDSTDSSGNTIAECTQFQDSYSWGPVATADVYMGGSNNEGEMASAVPVQIIAPSGFNAVPSGCSNGLPANDNVTTLGANGILGIGVFIYDCGGACAPGYASPPSPQPYYSCSSATCTPIPLAVTSQVQNPVALFANDNNGVVVNLGSIPATGAPSASGTLTFGIGTESNNGLGGATVLTVDGYGNVATKFNGVTYSDPASGSTSTDAGSFFDTGSNGLFILDATTLGNGIVDCPSGGNAPTSFYCPPSPVSLTATNVGTNGNTVAAPFTIASADNLFSNPANFAFNDIGGAFGGGTEAFDWGLPFFFNRTIYFAINGAQTPAGSGPFYAY